jgi:hypothetical protein
MSPLVLSIALLCLLGTGLGVLYGRYQASPAGRWRNQVLAAERLAKQLREQAASEAGSLPARRHRQQRELREQAFSSYLAATGVEELEAFTGIGPATVAKLRQSGYPNLAAMRNPHVHVPGLGEKRLADIAAAVAEFLRQAEERFASESVPQAQALASALRQLSLKEERLSVRARARANAADEALRQMEPAVAVARRISFARYLWTATDKLLPAAVRNAPLPEPAEAVAGAEAHLPSAVPVQQQPPGTAKPVNGFAAPQTREARLALLEIDPLLPLTAELVRRHFHLLCERYDEAKLKQLGPEFAALGRSRVAAITTAAQDVLTEMGEPLEAKNSTTEPHGLRENPDLDSVFGV